MKTTNLEAAMETLEEACIKNDIKYYFRYKGEKIYAVLSWKKKTISIEECGRLVKYCIPEAFITSFGIFSGGTFRLNP